MWICIKICLLVDYFMLPALSPGELAITWLFSSQMSGIEFYLTLSKKKKRNPFTKCQNTSLMFGRLEPIPVAIGWESGYTLHRSPVCLGVILTWKLQINWTTAVSEQMASIELCQTVFFLLPSWHYRECPYFSEISKTSWWEFQE